MSDTPVTDLPMETVSADAPAAAPATGTPPRMRPAAIPVDMPTITVTLRKLVGRQANANAERYTAGQVEIDLTPMLGDGTSIRTSKSLYEAAGNWSISLGDQVRQEIRDTIYALVEPMDLIEIRASRWPHLHAGKKLPLVMRGFVSSVRRGEAMDGEGNPQRGVTITGQDYGKLWLIHQILPQALYFAIIEPVFGPFYTQTVTGIDAVWRPAAEVIKLLTLDVVNKRVQELGRARASNVQPADSTPLVQPFAFTSTVPEGFVSPLRIGPFSGPYWGLAELISDKPWNELFIDDVGPVGREVPTVTFRPAPFRNLAGGYIMPGAADPGTAQMDHADVLSLDVQRSDRRVGNFFWVPPGPGMLDSSNRNSIMTMLEGKAQDFSYGNNSPALYGIRRMEVQTNLAPSLQGLDEAAPESGVRMVQWHEHRATQLKDMNRDNAALEEGSMTLRANEALRPGRYLRLTRGDMVADYYMTGVSHSFQPLRSWTASVTLVRGTGFLERVKMKGNPAYAEAIHGVRG